VGVYRSTRKLITSSTLNGNQFRLLGIAISYSFTSSRDRADGNCISCIKNESSTSFVEMNPERNLKHTVDMLSKVVDKSNNKLLLYIYDDVTVEKKIIIE
jgi:hypothetical protein